MKRQTIWLAAWLLAMVTVIAMPAGSQQIGMVDFEDHPANPPGRPGIRIDPEFYTDRGVRFLGGTVLEYEEGFTSSGRNGLEMCYSQEFCTTPFEISFDSPQWIVAVNVGYGGALVEPAPVSLFALDATGALVGFDELTLDPGSPVEVGPQLSVEDPERRITTVQVRWSDTFRLMNSLVIDDLFFEQFLPVVEVTAEPVLLTFESIEPEESDIVVTNVGNVAVRMFVNVDDPTGAFELVGTDCDEQLPPGDSCVLHFLFAPDEPGEYHAEALVRVPEGDSLSIPISGTRLDFETTSTTNPTTTTVAPTTTAAPSTTVVSTTVAPTTTAASSTTVVSTTENNGGGESNGGDDTRPPWILLVVAGGVGGGTWLMRRSRQRGQDTQSDMTNRPKPSFTVRLVDGPDDITTDERQPVMAIRIWVDSIPTTTLTEETL